MSKTELIIDPADRDLAFLELDDVALGRFARSYLIMIERQLHAVAGKREMPLPIAMSMHGAISLYRMCADANAAEVTLQHEGVEWGGKLQGNWTIKISRDRAPDSAA